MKQALSSFCLLLCVLTCSLTPQEAKAQFWKKLFKGEDSRKPVKKPINRTADRKNTSTQSKKKAPESLRLAPTVKKARYRVDVLVPLYLGELVVGGKPVYKSHLPDKVLPGLGFYQGFKLAADTLNSIGYKLDIYLHDITEPGQTVDALLKGSRLDSADLIIGAVTAQQLPPLAAAARKHNINFVSVLTPADGGVKINPYFNLLQPTLQAHCEALKAAIAKKAGRMTNLLMYQRSNVAVDMQCFRYLAKDSAFAYTRVAMNAPMPSEKLRNFLDSNISNIIVMPIVDATYATQMLEQLSKAFPRYRFEVYGMPSWKGINLLHKEGALPNIGITIPAPFYFDPGNSAGKGFSDAFNEKYGGRPSELAYRGYETLYWYAYLMKRYGTIFNEHFADNGVAPFTRFEIKPATDKEGTIQYYENKHVYLYRYQAGSFSVEQ